MVKGKFLAKVHSNQQRFSINTYTDQFICIEISICLYQKNTDTYLFMCRDINSSISKRLSIQIDLDVQRYQFIYIKRMI